MAQFVNENRQSSSRAEAGSNIVPDFAPQRYSCTGMYFLLHSSCSDVNMMAAQAEPFTVQRATLGPLGLMTANRDK